MSDAAENTAPETSQADVDQQPKTFDAEYVANLRKEAARYRTEAKANAEAAKELEEVKRQNLSELERAQQDAAEARKAYADLQMENLRQSVALDKKLPTELVGRLMGATREEMEQDADALLALVGAPRQMQPDYSQGAQTAAPTTPEQEFLAFTKKL